MIDGRNFKNEKQHSYNSMAVIFLRAKNQMLIGMNLLYNNLHYVFRND